MYESPLHRKSYSPDILHKVSDDTLESIGILAGDVIHLKDASLPVYLCTLVHKQSAGELRLKNLWSLF
jgi:hypothetical protein